MTRNEMWLKYFSLVKEYHEIYEKFPQEDTVYKNEEIGRWCKNQVKRYKNGDLLPNRIRMLESIGFKFKMPKKDKTSKDTLIEIKWHKCLDLLREYLMEYDNLPNLEVRYKKVDIGLWYASQKLLLDNNVMTSEHKESFLEVIIKYV